jgi:hypothetical protein
MGLTATVDPSVAAQMRRAAESLVIRARAGDQNAIAMIMKIRENVPRSRRAALAYDLIDKYIKKNPVSKAVRFGADRIQAEVTKETTLHGVKQAVAKGRSSKDYSKVVRCIERLPRRTDWLSYAAFVVADGRTVDERVICCILPQLRGQLVLKGTEPISIQRAQKAGHQICGEWDAEFAGEELSLARDNGYPLAVDAGSEVVPVDELFCRAFGDATDVDRVVEHASAIEAPARQPLRVGYVFGLARAIQGVTRRKRPISSYSKIVADELGD